MRRLILLALASTLALGLAPALAETAPPRVVVKDCRFQGMERAWWTDGEVIATVQCFARKLRVSPVTAVAIVARETGNTYSPRAYNATGCGGSGCLGLFQMHAAYYPGWAGAVRPWHERLVRREVWWNPRWNALVAVTKARRDGGWGAWSTCC